MWTRDAVNCIINSSEKNFINSFKQNEKNIENTYCIGITLNVKSFNLNEIVSIKI